MAGKIELLRPKRAAEINQISQSILQFDIQAVVIAQHELSSLFGIILI